MGRKATGVRVGRKRACPRPGRRVARLMRATGLRGVSRRKCLSTTGRERAAKAAPDLVQRNFTASGPDRLWWPTSPTSRAGKDSSSCL